MKPKAFFTIVVYVPLVAVEDVKQAMFTSGAGRIGDYEACCWQVEGVGQFRPMVGSEPVIGERGELTRLQEVRIEMSCEPAYLDDALDALRQAHPYEEPAYHYWQVLG